MVGLSELGMTDTGSRRGVRGFWIFGLLTLIVVVSYVVWRNYQFISQGLLRPDFGAIHQAYDFNFLILPVSLSFLGILFCVASLFWWRARRQLLRLSLCYILGGLVLFGLRFYVTNIEPERLVIRSIELQTPKLTKPVRVLHISDIQAGEIGDYQRKVFKKIRELKPDLILNTGDLLQVVPPTTFNDAFSELHALISEANPRLGSYAVFGDTERELYRFTPKELEPLVMLSSRSAQIDTGGGIISLHGLSLYQSKNEAWALRTILEWLNLSDSSEFRILMGHAPDYALEVTEQPIDLCLAGHTHGGQVSVPVFGPLVIDSAVPKEWAQGFRRIGLPYLNVSAGAGSNRFEGLPPMRFNCPTEMTVIDLIPL